MRKAGILIMLFAVLGYYSSIMAHELPNHYAVEIQESLTLDSSFPLDDYPEKNSIIGSGLFLALILAFVTSISRTRVPIYRRIQYMNPVFYQSNYVLHLL
ncbi:hypothetical protein [Halobacillus sp. Marseille-Q1614]|uniref:hypothetical protein n=1 Tax=Halobacillus sp. Marseille-Q1614 TaxID=2709134 RepID=UPI0015703427|nr:hypothetical protein [Halobacillus sp. Marseille-Q1614]